MPLNMKFNDWSLEDNTGLVETRVDWADSVPSNSSKSLRAFSGSSRESLYGARRFSVSGIIAKETLDECRADVELIKSKLRGTGQQMSGRLDLWGNGHWWAHLSSQVIASAINHNRMSIAFSMLAPDPFRRADVTTPYAFTPVTPDFEVDFNFGLQHRGTVPRIPLVCNLGANWQKGELAKIVSTEGWHFEHIVTQDLDFSKDVVIDGERFQVLEGGEVVSEGTSATTFPYLAGSKTQTLDHTGSGRYPTHTYTWVDRFWD